MSLICFRKIRWTHNTEICGIVICEEKYWANLMLKICYVTILRNKIYIRKLYSIAVAFRIKISMFPYFVLLLHYEKCISKWQAPTNPFSTFSTIYTYREWKTESKKAVCIQFSPEQNSVSKGFHETLFAANFTERKVKGTRGNSEPTATKNIFGNALTEVLNENRTKSHKNEEFT